MKSTSNSFAACLVASLALATVSLTTFCVLVGVELPGKQMTDGPYLSPGKNTSSFTESVPPKPKKGGGYNTAYFPCYWHGHYSRCLVI